MTDANKTAAAAKPNATPSASNAAHSREGNVPSKDVQEQQQMAASLEQQKDKPSIAINEGGRTNDSRQDENPKGAVHGLPQPALKGTWR